MIQAIIFDMDGTLIQLPINYDIIFKKNGYWGLILRQSVKFKHNPCGNMLAEVLRGTCMFLLKFYDISRLPKKTAAMHTMHQVLLSVLFIA